MNNVTDLEVVRGEKKERCLYCGEDAHPTPLACPRIARVEVDPELGVVSGISFWDDFFEEAPDESA